MKIKVSYGYTFNLGNYESERIDVSEEFEIDEVRKPIEVIEQIKNGIYDKLKEWVWIKGGKL